MNSPSKCCLFLSRWHIYSKYSEDIRAVLLIILSSNMSLTIAQDDRLLISLLLIIVLAIKTLLLIITIFVHLHFTKYIRHYYFIWSLKMWGRYHHYSILGIFIWKRVCVKLKSQFWTCFITVTTWGTWDDLMDLFALNPLSLAIIDWRVSYSRKILKGDF